MSLRGEPTVLLVEDDENVRRLIGAYLEREGFSVHTAADGAAALELFHSESPHLIILDLMLPKIDGWEVCRRIRSGEPRTAGTPIIMLTARGEERDRIEGLEIGADDYVTKPFSPKELVLRVRAILRRSGAAPDADDKVELVYPGLEINGLQRICTVNGNEVELTRREFDLLWHLAHHPGQAFERDQLLEQVWGYDFAGRHRTVDVHITRIREKIERGGSDSPYTYIQTVWGIGYKFEVLPAPPGGGVGTGAGGPW